MVVDAFTQYNQGGIGIHILNSGYAQLVSVFTICCDVSIFCESGGYCSITNSNTSFGNYGLKADGVGPLIQDATLVEQLDTNQFKIKGLVKKIPIGSAISINGSNTFFTVATTTDLSVGAATKTDPTFTNEDANLRTARSLILGIKSKVQIDTIDFINETYPNFDYNAFKCTRDLGYIIDAVADDMVLGTNYRSVTAGNAYQRGTANVVISDQKVETIAAINFARDQIVSLIASEAAANTVSENFGIVTDIISEGTSAGPAIIFPDPTGVDPNVSSAAENLQLNRDFLIAQTIGFISFNSPEIVYDEAKCRRDVGYIIDAITYDVLYGGNSQTIVAAEAYWNGGVFQLSASEKTATVQAYQQLRNDSADVVRNFPVSPYTGEEAQVVGETAATAAEATTVRSLFDILINLINDAFTATITTEEDTETSVAYSAGATFEFFQYSLISASGHTFEWVGSGTNINTALPSQGGVPIAENQVVETNGGQVYYTSTDEKGDFSIGRDLVIDRNTGTITGNTFDRSLFAVLTPYILALEG
jgi:hypothetical protein